MKFVDGWVTTREAAQILQVSIMRIDQLVKQGVLHARGEVKPFEPRYFPLHEVYAWWEKPEQVERRIRRWKKAGQWAEEALPETPPEGMRLLTCREAGAMLGIEMDTVQAYIRSGRLKAYRGGKGQKIGRYLLPLDEVERFRDDPIRRRCRANYERGRERVLTEPVPAGRPVSGEGWLNAQEAAELLGVNRPSIGRLRKRGRLRGHRLRCEKRKMAGCYYRQEEVEALLADAEYVRRRDAAQKGNSLALRRARAGAERIKFMEAMGREQLGHRSVVRQTPNAAAGLPDPWGEVGHLPNPFRRVLGSDPWGVF